MVKGKARLRTKSVWNNLLSLDNVSIETMSVHYGKKRILFAETVDVVEKEGKLILITSNLDKENLLKQYGEQGLTA